MPTSNPNPQNSQGETTMNTTDSLETLEIPLNKLLAWNDNVRTTAMDDGTGELAASIAAVGLLQGLVVIKQPRGKYAVIAGRRRLLALSQLAADGALKQTWPVPCRVAPKEADLPEISLTENFCRLPMHPADEFESFHRLVNEGKSVADVAARFGVTEAVVNRRLALARVSPMLLNEYRAGELNLELLQAFTITDDHEAQESLWQDLQPCERKPQTVRRMLSSDEIAANDKHVRFVGLAAYEAEGGTVRRDLFSEGEDGAYIADPAKLTRMVNAKLQVIANGLEQEGWKWITIQPEIDHQFVNSHRRISAPLLPLSEEAQAEIAALEKELDLAEDRLNQERNEEDEGEDENGDHETMDAITMLNGRIQAIRANRQRDYSPEIKSSCGVVIGVGYNGQPELIQGLLRKEDEAALGQEPTGEQNASTATPSKTDADETPAYSAALIESLTQHKTAAIAIELSQQPSIALAALVHSLVLNEFGLDLRLYRAKSSVQVSSRNTYLADATGSAALASLETKKMEWANQFPANEEALFSWCLGQPQEKLLELLAYCVSRTVHGAQTKTDNDPARLRHADELARALNCDLTKWFTPTAENFFLRVSKSKIAEAMAEAGKPIDPQAMKGKKADVAALAEGKVAGTGWLPEPVRISTVQKEVDQN
jgi:ParB family chromosome partitioning protein